MHIPPPEPDPVLHKMAQHIREMASAASRVLDDWYTLDHDERDDKVTALYPKWLTSNFEDAPIALSQWAAQVHGLAHGRQLTVEEEN